MYIYIYYHVAPHPNPCARALAISRAAETPSCRTLQYFFVIAPCDFIECLAAGQFSTKSEISDSKH